MDMDMVISTVSAVGFPIAITLYLLWERNTSMKEYTDTMKTLVTKVEILLAQHFGGSKDD